LYAKRFSRSDTKLLGVMVLRLQVIFEESSPEAPTSCGSGSTSDAGAGGSSSSADAAYVLLSPSQAHMSYAKIDGASIGSGKGKGPCRRFVVASGKAPAGKAD